MKLGCLMALIVSLFFGLTFVTFYIARTAHYDELRLQEQKEIKAYALLEESCRLTWPALGKHYVQCLTDGKHYE